MKKVTEEQPAEDLKITNFEATSLLRVYNKVMHVEFDDFNIALEVSENSIKVEDAVKAYAKLESIVIDKFKSIDQPSQESIDKANEELVKIGSKTIVIKEGLSKIPQEIFSKIKIKPIEILLLKRLNLY